MIRNLKAFGLVPVAALALCAMSASAAQAEVKITAGHTPSTHETTTVSGTQSGGTAENYLEADGQKVSCPDAHVSYMGSIAGGEATSLSLEAEYAGKCGTVNSEGGLNELATVNMHGCHYQFNQPSTIGTEEFTGTASLVCPEEKGPTVAIYLNSSHTLLACGIEIEPGTNNNLEHIIYKNVAGTPDKVTATATISGINIINEQSTCPGGAGTKMGAGTLHAHVTLEATNGTNDVWISG